MLMICPFTPLFFNESKDNFGITSRYIQKFAPADKILIEILSDGRDVPTSISVIDAITNKAIASYEWNSWKMNDNKVLYYYVLTGLSSGFYRINLLGLSSDVFKVTDNSRELDETTLIRYSMRDNRQRTDSVFFINGLQFFFEFRAPGGFCDDNWRFAVDNEQFLAPSGDIVELYSQETTQKVFTLGNAMGCPIWYAAMLNRILCCSYVYFDNVRYARKDSNVPEQNLLIEGLKSYVFKQSLQQIGEVSSKGTSDIFIIIVSINSSDIGQCTVTATGNVINVIESVDKSNYTITVEKYGTATVNILPEDGYQVKELTVDGASQGALSSFTFENVQEGHTMSVVMEIVEENPTNFLVRNDLPNVYYSSTQSAVDAIKTAYPNGLTQNITLTCIKPATEKRLSGTWIAELSKWNEKSICCLIIDGADRLVYDGKSLGGLQFKEVNNVLLRNISFVNCANYAGAYSPSELYALNFVGSASRNARNLLVYKCNFNGVYPSDLTKKAWRTIGSKYSENLTLLGCDISNDYGNCMKLTNCQYVSLIKNTISVDYSLGVVAHPSIMTLKNCYTLNVEDNKMSGDVRENYFELSNVDRFYFLRNEVSGGGGRAITMSSLGSMKEVVVDSNLFVGMLNGPAGGWMKEYINLGTAKIDRLCMNNNTCYMSGKFYEQYITKGGTVEDAYIYNNIAINATGTSTNSINGFIINRVKSLHTGNNLYESMRGLVVSPNADGESDYITVDWTTGRDVAKLQAAGYEANSIKVEDGTKLLEKQNGGDSYKLIEGLEYYSNMSYFPDADIEYKAKANTGNTRGCYNLAGIAIDETQEVTGYTGEDYSEVKVFGSTAQYSTLADSVLRLKHNTPDRLKLVVFSVIGSQRSDLILGKSGIMHTSPVLDANGEYQEDELYTINVD